ncbi:hypothetical protein [Halarcobacter sp.]|uniref:hypothetical protein n=1 Tax=Halarcobacter sp. TaxID=2321133 RepID=UPI002AA7B6A1|nr:hypothetical protein [Halarcobacter sp.]
MINKNINQKILSNTSFVKDLKKLYCDSFTIKDKINYLNSLVYFLTSNVTTKFSDQFLEEELNKISKSLEFNLSKEYKKKSILHVMTESYSIGGHTKLVELFIENSKLNYPYQSLVITDQKVELANSLKDTIDNLGELIIIDVNKSPIDKSKQLANIASNYELIVLHIHPHDITANLAFGNTKFKRPIIYLNHADHIFWCGVSISDLVLDLTEEGSYFSKNIRGIKKSKIINIPIIEKKSNLTKEDARNYLNIDHNKKIILSIASEYKYGKTKKEILNFANMAMNITKNVQNSQFLLIGPSKENSHWNEVFSKTKGKVVPLGPKDRELLEYYILSSDLYIESFPFASYTAFLDTALFGIKMMNLDTPIFTLDVVKENNISYKSIEELESNAIKFLNSDVKNNDILDLSNHLEDKWGKNLINILKNDIENDHQIYEFISKEGDSKYLNYIIKAIGSNLSLMIFVKKLPYGLQLKIEDKLLKYKIMGYDDNCTNIFKEKCFRKKTRYIRYKIKNKINQLIYRIKN